MSTEEVSVAGKLRADGGDEGDHILHSPLNRVAAGPRFTTLSVSCTLWQWKQHEWEDVKEPQTQVQSIYISIPMILWVCSLGLLEWSP